MILKITVASEEVEDFALSLKIDGDATFGDLHRLLQKACNYTDFGTHRFYVCNEDWEPEYRVAQTDQGSSSDEDIYLMDRTPLGELLEDEGQRLAYRFDPESKRMLLLEVTETIFGQDLDEPVLRKKHGEAPAQVLLEEEIVVPKKQETSDEEMEENFYGEEGYEADELDEEGFDVIE